MPNRPRPGGCIPVGRSDHSDDTHKSQRVGTTQTPLVQASIAAIGELHRYAADQWVTGLARAQALSQAMTSTPGPTPVQRAALHQIRRAYLWALLTAVNKVGITTVNEMRQTMTVSHIGAEQRRRIDEISKRYIQHVRTTLGRHA